MGQEMKMPDLPCATARQNGIGESMRILGIETSCDETAIALVDAFGRLRAPRFKIIVAEISSQIEVHRPFGGVVPNLAKREHLKNIPFLYQNIIRNSIHEPADEIQNSLDAIAVTVGPGLEPALWTGINFAKDLYEKLKKENKNLKIIGVNHLEGHLFSFLLPQKAKNIKLKNVFPAVALIVSGGHTILLKMDSLEKWKKIGETKDDAVGESFDKVAKMLELPYPGGPEIELLAAKGDCRAIIFPRPMINSKNYDFSFSGLKTSVLYYTRDHKNARKADVAASFEEAALDALVKKTGRAAKEFAARSILLSGGVAANKKLRLKLKAVSRELHVNFFAPPIKFNTDNAVMIAGAGYMAHLRKKNRRLTANGSLDI
ncbi:MAG: putative tRNA threonylcarbamoyladenosine biosynthesis protein Gcp [Candidatus Jorgensenbacteria bacterium GW2011_GWA2_45_9]|uniref:tRNA N6-adenosine threonylcarbamoyltransferase n=1 Tax=Candidatus Jorgensenbacteria bacterium GW2011_GWA2_45_9 TaxID=1618663 RepID=A0A0G1R3U0_9BACT|nr:MAG: putative tRNA threonylcarbamoyladenosine biosynthesis protein Gcp [Candidatus Jorgensenbacteria bacterium GW2011_GWA2_45_9]